MSNGPEEISLITVLIAPVNSSEPYPTTAEMLRRRDDDLAIDTKLPPFQRQLKPVSSFIDRHYQRSPEDILELFWKVHESYAFDFSRACSVNTLYRVSRQAGAFMSPPSPLDIAHSLQSHQVVLVVLLIMLTE